VAAVVYDDVFEPLILMAKDPRHPDPFIPSAFVTQKSGILMKRLMVEGETVRHLLRRYGGHQRVVGTWSRLA
jgi:hypothetical protein